MKGVAGDKPIEKELSEREKEACRIFVQYRYQNSDPTYRFSQACLAAGYGKAYSATRSGEIFRKDKIQKEIKLLKTAYEKDVDVELHEIITGFREIAFGSDSSEMAKLRALEDLGKFKGIFIERSMVETSEAPKMTDEEKVAFKEMADEYNRRRSVQLVKFPEVSAFPIQENEKVVEVC